MLIKDKLVSDKDGMTHLASQPLDYDQLSKLIADNEAIKEKKVVIDSNYFTLTESGLSLPMKIKVIPIFSQVHMF